MYDEDQKQSRKTIRKPIIDVPSSNETAVVFSWHRKWRRFDRSEYKPEYSDGQIPKEEIDHFLNEVDHLVRKVLRTDSILCFLFFVMLILAGVFGYIIKKLTSGGYTILFLVGWAVLIILIIGLMMMRRQKNLAKTKELVKKYIKKHHVKFRNQGLRWHIPKHFPLWIELRKQTAYSAKGSISETSVSVQMTDLASNDKIEDSTAAEVQIVTEN